MGRIANIEWVNILKMEWSTFPRIFITDRSTSLSLPLTDIVKIWSFNRWVRNDSSKSEQNYCLPFTQCDDNDRPLSRQISTRWFSRLKVRRDHLTQHRSRFGSELWVEVLSFSEQSYFFSARRWFNGPTTSTHALKTNPSRSSIITPFWMTNFFPVQ